MAVHADNASLAKSATDADESVPAAPAAPAAPAQSNRLANPRLRRSLIAAAIAILLGGGYWYYKHETFGKFRLSNLRSGNSAESGSRILAFPLDVGLGV